VTYVLVFLAGLVTAFPLLRALVKKTKTEKDDHALAVAEAVVPALLEALRQGGIGTSPKPPVAPAK
jgi:hypothetical protein